MYYIKLNEAIVWCIKIQSRRLPGYLLLLVLYVMDFNSCEGLLELLRSTGYGLLPHAGVLLCSSPAPASWEVAQVQRAAGQARKCCPKRCSCTGSSGRKFTCLIMRVGFWGSASARMRCAGGKSSAHSNPASRSAVVGALGGTLRRCVCRPGVAALGRGPLSPPPAAALAASPGELCCCIPSLDLRLSPRLCEPGDERHGLP